jgi:hypothetical protein
MVKILQQIQVRAQRCLVFILYATGRFLLHDTAAQAIERPVFLRP